MIIQIKGITPIQGDPIIADHHALFPVKNIGSATRIPMRASPVISPDANNKPLLPVSFIELFVKCAIMPPIKIGVDSEIGR